MEFFKKRKFMEDQNFDEKYASKLRTMIISNDREMVNLAKEIFEELKVEIIDFSPTVKLAREKLILGADKLLPYNFILTINTSHQFADEGLTNAKDILGKIRCDKLYLTTPVMIIGDDVSGEEEEIMENDSEVRFMNKDRYRSSLGTDFVNLIKNSYPEGPKSLKTAFKKGIYYIYIPNEMDAALFNEFKSLNSALLNNSVMIQILDFKKSKERMSDKEIKVLMEYCKESEKNKLPISSINIPAELLTVLQNKGIDRTFNPRRDLQDALKTINIDVKKKNKPAPQPSSGGSQGGGAGMKMNVNVINPFLAAGSELFKENEGKNVIVERPRLCIKFDDPTVQFASLIRFFDPKFKGGLLFAYSEKTIKKILEDNPSSIPARELSLHIEKIIDGAKLKSTEDNKISPSSIEILKTRDEIADAVGKKGAIRIRFVSEENWLDAYIIK